jgi:excisionase family DNA binding protein
MMKPLSKPRGAQRDESAGGDASGPVPAFYSVERFAGAMGVGEMSVYRAIHAGRLPAIKFGGRYLVPAKALEALIDTAMAAGELVDIENIAPAVSPGVM